MGALNRIKINSSSMPNLEDNNKNGSNQQNNTTTASSKRTYTVIPHIKGLGESFKNACVKQGIQLYF